MQITKNQKIFSSTNLDLKSSDRPYSYIFINQNCNQC